jgi:cytosine deaminase
MLVVGEDRSFSGHYQWLEEAGASVTVLDDSDCHQMMQRFIATFPKLWAEDIGEVIV